MWLFTRTEQTMKAGREGSQKRSLLSSTSSSAHHEQSVGEHNDETKFRLVARFSVQKIILIPSPKGSGWGRVRGDLIWD